MPRPIQIDRVFLGWDAPLLPGAALWLLARSAESAGPADLERLLVVTPGRRAGRRLLEHLVAAAAARGGLIPPVLATPGALAELLFAPRGPLVGALERRLLAADALRRAPSELVARVFAQPPATDDLSAWLELAVEVERIEEELAAEAIDLPAARRRLEGIANAAGVGTPEGERWEALATLAGAIEARVGAGGSEGVQVFRLRAAAGDAEPSPAVREGRLERVVLCGLPELPRLFRRLLEAAGLPVTALVMAPEREAEAFGPWGTPREELWPQRRLEPPAGSVAVADRPSDQTALAVERVLAWSSPARRDRERERPVDPTTDPVTAGPVTAGRVSAGPITIGVADPRLAPTLVDQLARAGVEAHAPDARSLASSLPATVLSLLGRYLAQRRLADLIGLLRLPPVERWVESWVEGWVESRVESWVESWGAEAGGAPFADAEPDALPAGGSAPGSWLSVLDRFAAECASGRVDRPLGGGRAGRELVRRLDAAVLALIEPAGERESSAAPRAAGAARTQPGWPRRREPPARWASRLAALLQRLFGEEVTPAMPAGERPPLAHASTLEALAALGAALRELHAIPEERSPACGLEEVVGLLLRSLADASAPASEMRGDEQVEVLGWLELGLDDAAGTVVVGINEGIVPAAIPADPFLSEGVRGALGLLDDRRRLTRDLYLLTTLVRSRERLALVCGRRTAEGEPLAPSRLLLAREAPELARAVVGFFEATPRAGVAATLVEWPATSAFSIPRPEDEEERSGPWRVSGLPVTAFRDYLACPYRFFLRHVLKLEPVREPARELDAAAFGRLAHEVLRRFALGAAADDDESETIRAALLDELDQVARELLGGAPVAAARVQVAQLRRRLEVFAAWQAEQRRQGWRIERVELRLESALDVDGSPFLVRGQLDRVDVHLDGRRRILDFKTADTPRTPEQVHRRGPAGEKEWIDLQLPLYRRLAVDAGVAPALAAGGAASAQEPAGSAARPLRLAFYSLSKKLSQDGYAEAEWSEAELADAEARARDVVRAIRAGVFWPPAEPPAWDDGYGWIAGDTLADRSRLLAGPAPRAEGDACEEAAG